MPQQYGGGGGGASGGTPALVLSTTAAAGSATTFIRDDDQIIAFDATVPVTQAFADVASAGSVAVAARRNHVHGMPVTPAGTILALVQYNPASITSVSANGGANVYQVADATNLTVTFTVPASGNVVVTLNCYGTGSSGSSLAQWALGVHGGSIVTSTQTGMTSDNDGSRMTAYMKLTGLTPGASVQYDWMIASGNNNACGIVYGITNSANNQRGPATMLVQAL